MSDVLYPMLRKRLKGTLDTARSSTGYKRAGLQIDWGTIAITINLGH